MASALNLHSQSARPQVVPQPVPQVISQQEITLILSLRARLRQLAEQVNDSEQSIRARPESGAIVEPGLHIAQIDTHTRRNVPWKEVAIRLAERLRMDGHAYCARVLAATKPTRTTVLTIE